MKRKAFVISANFTRKNGKELVVLNCLDFESGFPLVIFCPLSVLAIKQPNLVNHCLGDSHSPDNFGRYPLFHVFEDFEDTVSFEFVISYRFVKCGDDVFRPVLI